MSAILTTRCHRLAESLAELKVKVRATLATELAQAVRVLHQTPPFPAHVDYLAGMDTLFAWFRGAGLSTPRAEALIGRFVAFRETYSTPPEDLVASHNDLNIRNVLYDGRRLWLIDWDAAFLADGRDWLEDLARASEGQSPPIAVATLLRRESRTFSFDGRLVVDADGRAFGELADPACTRVAVRAAHAQVPHGTARVVPIEGAGELFVDAVASRPRLVVAGGGHARAPRSQPGW